MARQGLPKMYAKMGFKKGWREYKRSLARRRGKKRVITTKRKKAPSKRRTYTAPKRRRTTMARRRKKTSSRRKTIRIGTVLTIGTVAAPMAAPIIQEAMTGGTDYVGAAQQGMANGAAAIPAALSVAAMTYIARFFIKGGIPVGRYTIAF